MTSQLMRDQVQDHLLTPKNSEGYEIYPVVDAIGGTSVEAHQTALQHMSQADASLTSWAQLLGELQRYWARTETAEQCREMLFSVEGR